MHFKQEIAKLISKQVGLSQEQIEPLIERPKNAKLGDYAFPCFALAKLLHQNPTEVAKNLANKLRT